VVMDCAADVASATGDEDFHTVIFSFVA